VTPAGVTEIGEDIKRRGAHIFFIESIPDTLYSKICLIHDSRKNGKFMAIIHFFRSMHGTPFRQCKRKGH